MTPTIPSPKWLKDRRYLLSLVVLYLNFFLHGIGVSILGQSVVKEMLSAQWGTSVMGITSIAGALGLGRLIALPIAGPLSDKLGRRASIVIGGIFYVIYMLGIAMAVNDSLSGYTVAYVCAVFGGVANSFLDTGIYPSVGEIVPSAPGVATMGLKFSMAVSQIFLPFFLGLTMGDCTVVFWVCGIAYLLLAVAICFLPLPDADVRKTERTSFLTSLKEARFSIGSIALIFIGFTCTGTFQLWINCAQNFAKDVVGWSDPSILQSYYSVGTFLAIIVTSILTRKIKEMRFFVLYPAICLVALVCVVLLRTKAIMVFGAFAIGWAGAGGVLQLATSACNQLFPKIGGTMTALVMLASSLCNYTLLTAASSMTAHQVMMMNIVVTLVGIFLGLLVNLMASNTTSSDRI